MPGNLLLKHHIRFLSWSGYFGLKPYIPALSALRQEPKDSETLKATAWVYGFKRHFKYSDDVRMILDAAAKHFCCDAIVPIPPSDPASQPNSLQKLFGMPITRTAKSESRKYHHKQALPGDYAGTYELTPPDGRRFLLVDDIFRTGSTIQHFQESLINKGYEVVPLAVGFYYRLPFILGDSITVFVEKTGLEINLEELMFKI